MFTENSEFTSFAAPKHVPCDSYHYLGLQNMLPFFLYITVHWNRSLYHYFLFNLIFHFSSVLLRDQKWGMDLLGISGFFSQRAHTRNFCGLHPWVTFLATHKLFLFSSQYDDSSAIPCCPYCTSCTTPIDIPPTWSLFQFAATTQPLPQWTSLP